MSNRRKQYFCPGESLVSLHKGANQAQETQRVSHDKTASRIVAVGNASGMPIFSRLNHYQTVILSLSLGGQQEFCILLSEDGVQPWASLTHTPYHVLSTKSHLLSTNPTEMQWLRPHLMGLL